MKFGIYIHIPFCTKRCSYCDFAVHTEFNYQSLDEYTNLIVTELTSRGPLVEYKNLHSVYFGGGTPSLLGLNHIEIILKAIKKAGFITETNTEITIEINPESLSLEKLSGYKNLGINRFSLGVQSFQPELLKACNREHSLKDNQKSIALLQGSNFSVDWLFGLPQQNFNLLTKDAQLFLQSGASHISPYLLTLQDFHPMNKNRPPDEEQIHMLNYIRDTLIKNSFNQYEISNFAKSKKESQHNKLYWEDQAYWGVGLSSHSYFPTEGSWGVRSWNSSNRKNYSANIRQKPLSKILDCYPSQKKEFLTKSDSLQDFCYTHLRTSRGLSETQLLNKFGQNSLNLLKPKLTTYVKEKLLLYKNKTWLLRPQGINISNNIFLELSELISQ